jgi:archaemetzincin
MRCISISSDDTLHKKAPGGIAIIPSGEIDRDVLTFLGEALSVTFTKKTYICPPLPKPAFAFDSRRRQYLSTAILRTVSAQHEYRHFKRVLVVVDVDLYVPRLNFVFGIASGESALISLTRLAPEWYGYPADRVLFQRRVLTEAVHELGHTFGLPHCTNPLCVMFFSNCLEDTDRKGPEFCARCARKTQSFKKNQEEKIP